MESIIDWLNYWVTKQADKTAFISLESEGELTYSYAQIKQLVDGKSSMLSEFEKEESAILLYDNSIDFLTTFLACQQIGIIPIPMFYPRNDRYFERLEKILKNAGSKLVVFNEKDASKISKGLDRWELDLNKVSLVFNPTVEINRRSNSSRSDIAFIQYTSGSTSDPKGVIVSHSNLLNNEEMIKKTFNCDDTSTILTWLPFYHDMGLIGNLLHTLYVGAKCIVLNPITVVSTPLIWMQLIGKYKVTHSGGPNFIYDACNAKIGEDQLSQLDLSSWKVAYNGAEPIKYSTIVDFKNKFATAGFSEGAFKTCYGLAESTLLVSGGSPTMENETVSSGEISEDIQIVFYDEETKSVTENRGEICLAGGSVTRGYWKKDSASFFIKHNGKSYLRTGDIGERQGDHLLVSGRTKEMLIVNGQNIFPYDLEATLSEEVEELISNGVALCEGSQGLSVFSEFKRELRGESNVFFSDLRKRINKVLIDSVGIEAENIVFVLPRSLPRTSSGKIKRVQIHKNWECNELKEIGKTIEELEIVSEVEILWNKGGVEKYLISVLTDTLKLSSNADLENKTFFELGLSSIKGVEIVNKISKELQLEIEVEQLFELNKLDKVVEYILNLKWLNNTSSAQGKEITL